ncbi:MAG: TetR/AcrR family transcriptional regulator [Actinobacteria bacterium]|nr:TetR/AcrR family transcriptional regulator [Actinomycetota bacterium]
MPRDASDTRQQLIDAGRRLFARNGVYQTPLKQIVEDAGQKNASALHYHFGGRGGLLAAIIEGNNGHIESDRKEMLDSFGTSASLNQLVQAVIYPLARQMKTSDGLEFIIIISQLQDKFRLWDTATQTPPQALRTFHAISEQLAGELDVATRRERIELFLNLVVSSLSARARQRLRGEEPELLGQDFIENLVTMSVGALQAR